MTDFESLNDIHCSEFFYYRLEDEFKVTIPMLHSGTKMKRRGTFGCTLDVVHFLTPIV
ncbi:hypothetical protein [Metabacillus arenae]|uniref:hypothetical protein n=1 Tax=Metabacillus arenae TaxID=2771434 RepID=UPI0017469F70|nr:hypothetical protein [Metabacillus arenae]